MQENPLKNPQDKSKDKHQHNFFHDLFHRIELSTLWTVIGIIILFASSIAVVLIAPRYVDSWSEPSSQYQVQMYEVADPHIYISSSMIGPSSLQFVYHLKENYTLLSFQETDLIRFVAPPELEKYITRYKDTTLKLTSRLLLLRKPKKQINDVNENQANNNPFDAVEAANRLKEELKKAWETQHPEWKNEGLQRIDYDVFELYSPNLKEAFSIGNTEGIIENWVEDHYVILDETPQQPYHADSGVIYVNNPQEYRISFLKYGDKIEWQFDEHGERIKNIDQLQQEPLGFRSRKELIAFGEHIYAIEGCWYCHTDQTRTLVQDVTLNGSDTFPAPPSAPNEYIYQKVTFPGTRRIGPDLSRVGVKRPSRDWHKAHFWSPKTESKGSIMPSFRHFFDYDPRGTSKNVVGVPNYQFEGIFQYLMTKGTRITPPTKAWWLGKDPVDTIGIIEGRKK